MEVCFTINGNEHKIAPNHVPLDTTLNTYIRDHANLRGTKFMCQEGGCGACIVTVNGVHPFTKKYQSWAINSCLTPIYSCHEYDIWTIEGIGNKKDGYHKIQKRLVQMNGIQCGYCSPGMVMNMHSLLESKNGNVSMKEIENSFGGNICRCTGYRPILDAFKSLANDADPKLLEQCNDIEDLKICSKNGKICTNGTNGICRKEEIHLYFNDDQEWYKVYKIEEIFEIFKKLGDKPYMLVSGNTAHGVYRRNSNCKIFIDISGVDKLKSYSITHSVLLGGNLSLNETINILDRAASSSKSFKYVRHLVHHIDLIANVPVRNSGTIAGNLFIKYQHNEFPSDLFIIFEAINAKLTISDCNGKEVILSPNEFLKHDMHKKIILNIEIPGLEEDKYIFRSYKIMPRAQNAHAYVNSGFLVKMNKSIVESARICFGGINPEFVHAEQTEKYLVGKDLYCSKTLKGVLENLTSEVSPDLMESDASPEYRKQLAIGLYYKFVLNICPENIAKPMFRSGGDLLERSLSSGKQVFESFKERFPINEAVARVDGIVQSAGETQYSNDLPKMPGELWAAFVPATKVHAIISGFDASQALKIKGVKAFFSAKDIPGKNNSTPTTFDFILAPEEILCSEKVLFNGQPAGIIVAETNSLAQHAASLVKILYNETNKPVLTSMREIIKFNISERIFEQPFGKTQTECGKNLHKKVKGNVQMGAQYHFTMEPQTCVSIPSEDGLTVYSATQWMDFCQAAISDTLNLPMNRIHLEVRRLGGGYGGKISRANQIACACSLAAYILNAPVRMVLSIETNMSIIGKRFPCYGEYEVDIDQNGKIQQLMNKYYQDHGCVNSEPIEFNTTEFLKNCYETETWSVLANGVLTDTPPNTWCRSPGSTEAIAMIEHIMEHIAKITGVDPVTVRLQNINDSNPIKKIIPEFLKSVDYDSRKIEINQFNLENRWKKRGISFVPLQYPINYFGHYPTYVSIYHVDGTVAISHGGIEMGQGINTKITQVAAKTLNIPIEKIIIRPSNTLIAANSFVSGGSIASETVAFATMKACEILNERIKPFRTEKSTWEETVSLCNKKDVDLTAKYLYKADDLKAYSVYAVSCAEIETDLLTGNVIVKRVDILEDTGESISPLMDIGQVEGAFIMGLGLWLTETINYGTNGELLNNRTWNYKPPGPKDIPIDFRIKFIHNSPNESFVLRSKATGEPPLCTAVVILFALRHALDSARKDAGLQDEWYTFDGPATPEKILLTSGTKFSDFTL